MSDIGYVDDMKRCHICTDIATAYWHDAGPFGAGTFWGCDQHAPDDATHVEVDWFDDDRYRDDWNDLPVAGLM